MAYYFLQDGCPFIVCMTYAFQTPEKLCFILDLMNGGDLHYHLSQHGVFSETEVRFYAAEVILGLEHMHTRFIVYRDLKVLILHSDVTMFLCLMKNSKHDNCNKLNIRQLLTVVNDITSMYNTF